MSATVLHGRRRGKNRATPEITLDMNVNAQSAPPGRRTQNLNEVCVMSKNDWNRIQAQLHRRQIEEERRRSAEEDKMARHQRSLTETKNWANTIAGQRQKKLEARKLREAQEEEEKKRIDVEEAKYQAEKRKDAIEKAKTLQYYQTDRVKGFHGALVLTEVLKEREAQLELKRLRSAATAGKDMEWAMKEKQEVEEANRREQEKALKRLEMHREAADVQRAQIQQHHEQMLRQKAEEEMEADALKKLQEQYAFERQQLEEIRRRDAKELLDENLQQIEDVERVRRIRQQQEEEADDECRIFAAAKRKMLKLRADKERQLHNEKQERLEAIRSKLGAQKMAQLDDEDERIRRAVEEAEAKHAQDEQERAAKTKKAFEEMEQHRLFMMEQQERRKQEEKRREDEAFAVTQQMDAHFLRAEAEKQARRRQGLKDVADHHLQQMEQQRALGSAQQQDQLAQDAYSMNLIALEEQQFQEYANKVIEHGKKTGRNVYPLQRAAKEGAGGGLGPLFLGKGGVRPSYLTSDQAGVQLPAYRRGTTDEVKDTIQGKAESGTRLGFVW